MGLGGCGIRFLPPWQLAWLPACLHLPAPSAPSHPSPSLLHCYQALAVFAPFPTPHTPWQWQWHVSPVPSSSSPPLISLSWLGDCWVGTEPWELWTPPHTYWGFIFAGFSPTLKTAPPFRELFGKTGGGLWSCSGGSGDRRNWRRHFCSMCCKHVSSVSGFWELVAVLFTLVFFSIPQLLLPFRAC